MKVIFATALLAVAIEAQDDYENFHINAYMPNETYDYSDQGHSYYGTDTPASPGIVQTPLMAAAVDSFDTYGTLFGEHRYQLQVAKTANMLIGVEALREAIAALEERVAHLQTHVEQNESDIDENASDIDDNAAQIEANIFNLEIVDSKISYLEFAYTELEGRLAIDRDAIVIMCHQYAYAAAIPDECVPIIGMASAPLPYMWAWPQDDCPLAPTLPPYANPVPMLVKETTDDTDDFTNMPHQPMYLNDHDEIHDLSSANHVHENGIPLGTQNKTY